MRPSHVDQQPHKKPAAVVVASSSPPPNNNNSDAADAASPPIPWPPQEPFPFNILDFPPSSPSHFSCLYTPLDKLHSDYFTTFRRCTHIASGVDFACKTIHKYTICTKLGRVDSTRREVSNMQLLSASASPSELRCIVKLHHVIEDANNIHLLMELCQGVSLHDLMERRSMTEKLLFSEMEAAEIMKALLEALLVCHRRGIAHRDIKPKNLLVARHGDSGVTIKLLDFGRSVRGTTTDGDYEGPPFYVAPEILEYEPYGEAVDMWSAGVIAYVLLSGKQPFERKDERSTKMAARAADAALVGGEWARVSLTAKRFIRGLLCRDPAERMKVSEALGHPWIVDNCGLNNGRQLR